MPDAVRKRVRAFTDVLLTRRPDLGSPENEDLLKDITVALIDFFDQEAGTDRTAGATSDDPYVMASDEALTVEPATSGRTSKGE